MSPLRSPSNQARQPSEKSKQHRGTIAKASSLLLERVVVTSYSMRRIKRRLEVISNLHVPVPIVSGVWGINIRTAS